MVQKRFNNFGTSADAGKTKDMNQQLFAPAVLRADTPGILAAPPSQVILQPHSVIFPSGLILVEDEAISVDITTGFSSADFTISYEHTDVDQIGGAAAVLRVDSGLLQVVTNGVILGWVKYPGGSVPIDASMIFIAFPGRVVAGQEFKEILRRPSEGAQIASSGTIATSNSALALGQVVPPTPFRITLPDLVVSKRIALTTDQHVRVFDRTTGADMTRVTTIPNPAEYTLNETTGLFTFNSADEGNTLDISDFTYGMDLLVTKESAGSAATRDLVFTFTTFDLPIKTLMIDYVILTDYTVDPVEVLDINGQSGTFIVSKNEPDAPGDGSISRTVIRLLTGVYQTTNEGQVVLRLRESLGALGQGVLLQVRASVFDLPF